METTKIADDTTFTATLMETESVPDLDAEAASLVFEFDELTLNHRCDRCGAAAVSQVFILGTTMLFCGHHTRKNLDILTSGKYPAQVPEDIFVHTWRSHYEREWDNQFRDGGSPV